jgi:uncharacterized protein YbjT (DUF2867 family)
VGQLKEKSVVPDANGYWELLDRLEHAETIAAVRHRRDSLNALRACRSNTWTGASGNDMAFVPEGFDGRVRRGN